MKTLKSASSWCAMVLFASLLIACGSGDGGSSVSGSGTGGDDSIDVSGFVADGYITGATVCLDMNDNKVCDTGEPSAITVAGGAYTIPNISQDDLDNYPVLVEVPASAEDSDNPGVAIGKGFVLSAPKGAGAFVSPLTTMVQTTLEANPAMTVSEAEAVIKSKLGYSADSPVSLFTDFETKQNDPDYARLKKVAQVVAQSLITNLEAATTAATSAGVDSTTRMDEILALVVKDVILLLDTVASQVDAAGAGFDPKVVAASAVGAMDTTTIAVDITNEERAQSVVAALIMAALQNNIYSIVAESYSGATFYNYAEYVLSSTNIFVSTEYTYLTGSWSASGDWFVYRLGGSGWSSSLENEWLGGSAVTFNADGSAMLTTPSNTHIRMAAASLDLSGMEIESFLSESPWHSLLASVISPATAIFSSGAVGYNVVYTNMDDVYQLSHWTPESGTTCGDGGDVSTYNGNCNVVYGKAAGPTTSFAEFLYPAGTDLTTVSGNYTGVADNVTMRLVGNDTDTAGTAGFYGASGSGYIGAGTWTKRTVNGVVLIMIDAPASVQGNLWDKRIIYGVHNGYVRRGSMTPGGNVHSEWLFNAVAQQDITVSYFSP